nr:electrogenic sodium bicarbonate cotransporter 1-like [Vulpes vulpes]
MQWVFKELSTEAGFPQTIITSTPDKPNFLSWMEDEAVLDRGASFLKHVCDEEEVEGHHTIYIGVHVPKSYRRRRRHKRKTGHKEKKEKERISENYSDKSDVENADESSSSILKPLSDLTTETEQVASKLVKYYLKRNSTDGPPD